MLFRQYKPLELNEDEILKRLEDPFTKNHYARAGIDIKDLLTNTMKSKRTLQNGVINCRRNVNLDMWPRDEFNFGRILENILNEQD